MIRYLDDIRVMVMVYDIDPDHDRIGTNLAEDVKP
jgi:hypothetical protein